MEDRIGAALLGLVGGVIGDGGEESAPAGREPTADAAPDIEPEGGPEIGAAAAIDDEPVFTARSATAFASEPDADPDASVAEE